MNPTAPTIDSNVASTPIPAWRFGDVFRFYNHLGSAEQTHYAEQWGSLASCSQYRLPYLKTAQYVPTPVKVLDWGCGNGHFSYFLLANGFEVDAYSFQEPPAFLTTQPGFHHTKAGTDPVTLPYGTESFDVVFSIGVLEHVHESGGDQRASILEVERILKKNGQFLVFHLPNRFTWIEFFVRLLNRITGPTRHAHTKLFTRSDVDALFKDTSFEIVDSGRYNIIPRNSFNRLPKPLANSPRLTRWIDALDDAFGRLFAPLTQNWYFILRKTT